ncbi:hypothetical protein [Deinococcus sonorensis]|uniref:Uncharacterized protein n=1 Tax=Deinococcus sonorensis TaxID=309891 RepID=A0ABV8Y3G4_9DEIO
MEVFRDGRRRCATSLWAAGSTVLATVQVPPLDEMLTDPKTTAALHHLKMFDGLHGGS